MSRELSSAAVKALHHVAGASSGAPVDPRLRVTLNFHPDRAQILQALVESGLYLSQFATGTSNGGLTAHPGGDRWHWESKIFGGAYDDALATTRPVYGALNFRHKPVGAAPRFGSVHLRLSPGVLPRTTFCYPDSHREPANFAVAAKMPLIKLAESDDQDHLDDYIEAQVHGPVQGPVQLDRDVEALVLDPSYRDTAVEVAARQLPCLVEWHHGFRLSVEELRRHPEYRGQRCVDLGAAIAVEGWLTPKVIGDAVALGMYADQDLKRVWHCLARFGCVPSDRR